MKKRGCKELPAHAEGLPVKPWKPSGWVWWESQGLWLVKRGKVKPEPKRDSIKLKIGCLIFSKYIYWAFAVSSENIKIKQTLSYSRTNNLRLASQAITPDDREGQGGFVTPNGWHLLLNLYSKESHWRFLIISLLVLIYKSSSADEAGI